MARLMAKEGKSEPAAEELDAVMASWKQSLGPDHPNVAEGSLFLAQLASARRDFATARTLLEEALKIHQAKRIANKFTANMHLELAKALWFIPGANHKLEARAHAEKAAELLARFGGTRSEMLRELDAWLAQHRP